MRLRVALTVGLSACVWSGVPAQYAGPWGADWNRRLDFAPTRFQHPCATLEFSAWADGFLDTCAPFGSPQEGECEYREEWVRARSGQCQQWVAYLLRNHNQQVRDDTTREPSMRVEPDP